ncbi:PQ loop repeat-domain-containing protein [Diplogelasinospora grovesii]|uniref:PQ loop repeat-domain-containing protein n=1 Tax=Diplogelasinospora grovesii TaxID=303347 RepID=A0AAN6NCD4_9PEZI|nr:PQ loop repeat-domain-containing protein [Diplogelasinospora grovesii]
MAPQTDIPVGANVLGTIGTVFWCVQLVPQIWTNWRTKKTDGLPGIMMFLWALCGVPFGVYAIVQDFNIPLQVQPQVFMALCLICWAQTLLYRNKWRWWAAWGLALLCAYIFAGLEAVLIIFLRPGYDRGDGRPITVIGVVAAILLALGLLPPYWEIWKRKGRVVGINWVFLAMDWSGAFLSLMALVAQNTFDVLGGVLYIICCLLELGIFASHIIWLLRTRRIREEAAAQNMTFDDLVAEHERNGIPFKFAPRKAQTTEGQRQEYIVEGPSRRWRPRRRTDIDQTVDARLEEENVGAYQPVPVVARPAGKDWVYRSGRSSPSRP